MPAPIVTDLVVEDGSWQKSTEMFPEDEIAQLWAKRPVVVTQPWLWPIRDTDEGRCHVVFAGDRERLAGITVRGKELEICRYSLGVLSVRSCFRRRVLEIIHWKLFDSFILFLILANSVALAIYQYREPDHIINKVVDNIADPIFTVFFSLECVLKIIAWGLFLERNTYLRDAWNWLDFIVVVTAVISWAVGGQKFSTLRVFRVLRPLRSLQVVPDLKFLVQTMLNSVIKLFDVSVMGLFLFCIFGIVGISLWSGVYFRQCRRTPNPVLSANGDCWDWQPNGEERLCGGRYSCASGWCGGHLLDSKVEFRPVFPTGGHRDLPWCPMNSRTTMSPILEPPKLMPESDFLHFDHIGGALLIVFQSMTMEGWTDIMYQIQDGYGALTPTIYFFLLIVMASFFLLNIFLAVIGETWNDIEQSREEEEEKEAEQKIAEMVLPEMEEEMVLPESDVTPQTTVRRMQSDLSQISSTPSLTARMAADLIDATRMSVGSRFSSGTPDSRNSSMFDQAAQANCPAWVDHPWVWNTRAFVFSEEFTNFILFIIAANVVTMCMDEFPPNVQYAEFLHICEIIFIVIFAVEMILMVIAMGPKQYTKNPLTCFDGVIVITSIIERVASDSSALRAFRGFRLVRVIVKIANKWGSFRILLRAMVKTVISLGYFAVLFIIVLYIFTLLFLNLFATKFHFTDDSHAQLLLPEGASWCYGRDFGKRGEENQDCIPRAHFDTFLWAFVTVFQIMSCENWNTIMYDGMRANGWLTAGVFVFIVVFGQIMILNLFLTILMCKFQDAQDDAEAEEAHKLEEQKEKEATMSRHLSKKSTNVTFAESLKKSLSGKIKALRGAQVTPHEEAAEQDENGGASPPKSGVHPAVNQSGDQDTARAEVIGAPDEGEGQEAPAPPGVLQAAAEDWEQPEAPEVGDLPGTPHQRPEDGLLLASPPPASSFSGMPKAPTEAAPVLEVTGTDEFEEAGSCLPGTPSETAKRIRKLSTFSDLPKAPTEAAPALEVTETGQFREGGSFLLGESPETTNEKLEDAADQKAMAMLGKWTKAVQDSPKIKPVTSPDISDNPDSQEDGEEQEQQWASTSSGKKIGRAGTLYDDEATWPWSYSFFIFSPFNPLRRVCRTIVVKNRGRHRNDAGQAVIVRHSSRDSRQSRQGRLLTWLSTYRNSRGELRFGRMFDNFILACILISSTAMALDTPLRDPEEQLTILIRTLDQVFGYIFLIEMVVKLIAQGLVFGKEAYLQSAWNWLDGTVVLISLIGNSVSFLKTLRILRAFRPLRVISRNENLKVVVRTILSSMPELATLFSLSLVFLLVISLFCVTWLKGTFHKCVGSGVGPIAPMESTSFVTPLCLGSPNESACPSGAWNATNEVFQQSSCSTCSGSGSLGSWQQWQRVTVDTPICVGRCNAVKREESGLLPQDICPPLLTSVTEFPSVCPGPENDAGELNLDLSVATPSERIGINYVQKMMMQRVMPCAGPEPSGLGGCRALFCPEGASMEKKDSCHADCWKHPYFCYDVCHPWRLNGTRDHVPHNTKCGLCLNECQGSCECADFCEPLIKDAAICVEQGGSWNAVMSQNFNSVFNSMLTLFEISTTEMWVDVMYNAVDSNWVYMQPFRDRGVQWAIFFVIFIFFSNMFIINLSVGVIVENFVAIKRSNKGGAGLMLTDAQQQWINSQKHLYEKKQFFPLTNLHLRPPWRRRAHLLVESKPFEHGIMVVIVLNAITMMIRVFPEPYDWWSQFVEAANYTFAAIFCFEFSAKFFAHRATYWHDHWNIFDFAVVIATLFGIALDKGLGDADASGMGSIVSVMRIFRIFRILRVFRLIRFLKGLNRIFMALLSSIPRLANVFVLLMLLMILYSILGVSLFSNVKFIGALDDHGNFRNFFWAFTTLFRATTGEIWNEIMHDLGKDEHDHLAAGSWCSPAHLFDAAGTHAVLKDKCLIEHPNSCGNRFFHESIFFFVSYTVFITWIIMNVVIAVIIDGYEEGTASKEAAVVDDCVRFWKKYDSNCTMFLNMPDTFMFIEDVLKEQSKEAGIDLASQGVFGPVFSKLNHSNSCHTTFAAVPMKCAKTLEDLQMNDDGEINFLCAVKLVLRVVFAKNDKDLLDEIEKSEEKLSDQNPRLLEKIKKSEEKSTLKSGLSSSCNMRVQIAAAKIQRSFKARQARKIASKRCEEKREELRSSTRESFSSQERVGEFLVSSDSQHTLEADGAVAQDHLIPRSGAAIDSLDVRDGRLGHQNWESEALEPEQEPEFSQSVPGSSADPFHGNCAIWQSVSDSSMDGQEVMGNKDACILRSAAKENEDPPEEIMVPPVAG